MANEFLAVHLDEEGIVHSEDGKLIVGDLDVVRKALAAWGGNRQRGRVQLRIYLRTQASVDLSPDMNGTFAEGSEPGK